MQTFLLFLMAVAALAAAAFVQLRLTRIPGGYGIVRLLLALTGLGVGWVALRYGGLALPPDDDLARVLVFLTGFGVAHVPALCILLLKRIRHRQEAATGSRSS